MYIALAIIVSIIALAGTLVVGRDVSSQLKEYEVNGDTLENELSRSHAYEKTSLKRNVKSLTWIYVLLMLVVLGVCLVFFIV